MQRVHRKMRLKAVTGIVLTVLLVGMLTLAFNIQSVKASGTIYITSDYTFTHNIYEPIVVLADNIVIDGNGYTLQGPGNGIGMNLTGRSNVTIKNTNIKYFEVGVILNSSSFNTISGNNVTNNTAGIWLAGSSNNIISENNITHHLHSGLWFLASDDNTVSGNTITNNAFFGAVFLQVSFFNTFAGNNITNNNRGFFVEASSNNKIYHNSFIDNTHHAYIYVSGYSNVWDDGYPSGGNYWSDYEDRYPDAEEIDNSGIWDTPYVIDENNQDNYPLMDPTYYNVAIKAYCYTESAYVSVSITMDGLPTGFNTSHIFINLTGTQIFTVPNSDPNGHPFTQWSTGETSTTITVTSGGTYTAYYGEPPPPPVGGIWLPVDKLALLAPYIALASTILLATAATAIYVKHVKRRNKKQ